MNSPKMAAVHSNSVSNSRSRRLPSLRLFQLLSVLMAGYGDNMYTVAQLALCVGPEEAHNPKIFPAQR